jgi:GH24 family phage-related lysozyme (muramidase)
MPDLEEELKVGYENTHNEMTISGFLPPSENITVPAHYKKFDQSNPSEVYDSMFNQALAYHGPAGLGEPGEYNQNRFDFITTEEGYNGSVHKVNGINHVGYGTNLEANPTIVQDVLGFSPEKYQKLLAGEIILNEAQSRRLFDFKVQESEKIVQSRLEGVPLNANQRISLVSMAYNSPALIGPNLIKHLKGGDAASVSYEILNLSNANKLKGLDSRRQREHDKFFGNNPSLANIQKGDDYRKRPDTFNFASLLGISSAQADTLKPFAKVKMSKTAPEPVTSNIVDKIMMLSEMFSFEAEEKPLENIEPSIPLPTPKPENFEERIAFEKEMKKKSIRSDGINEPISEVDLFLEKAIPIKNAIPAPVRAVMIWATEGLIKKAGRTVGFDKETMDKWSPAGKQVYGANFFSSGARDVLRQMAEYCQSKGKKSCKYQDWDELFGVMDVNGMFASEMVNFKDGLNNLPKVLNSKGMSLERPSAEELHKVAYGNSILGSLTKMSYDFYDPRLEALMTIGQFTFTEDDNGNLIVGNDNKEMDEYNFKKNMSRTRGKDETFFYAWFRQLFADEDSEAKFGFRVNLGRK